VIGKSERNGFKKHLPNIHNTNYRNLVLIIKITYMSRALIAGATDYSHQSIDDIVLDFKEWVENISDTIKNANERVSKLKAENEYWDKVVYPDFKSVVQYSLVFLATTEKEIVSIMNDVKNGARNNHILRLKRLGKTAHELHLRLGKIWNGEYPKEQIDYKGKEYRELETLYSQIRNMVADLMDLSNVQERLSDFIDNNQPQKIDSNKNNDKTSKVKLILKFFCRKDFLVALIVGLIIFSLGIAINIKDKKEDKIAYEQKIQLMLERAEGLFNDGDYEGVINLLDELYIQGDIVQINDEVKSFYYGLVKKYEAGSHFALANSVEDIDKKKEHYKKAISAYEISTDSIEPSNVSEHDKHTKDLLFHDFINVNKNLGMAFYQSALLEKHPGYKLGRARDTFEYILEYIDSEKNSKEYGDLKRRLGLTFLELSLYEDLEKNLKNSIINIAEAENTVVSGIVWGDNGPKLVPPFYFYPEFYNYIIRQDGDDKILSSMNNIIDDLCKDKISKDKYPYTYFDIKLVQAVIYRNIFLINENQKMIDDAFNICDELIDSYQDKPVLHLRALYIKDSLSFIEEKNLSYEKFFSLLLKVHQNIINIDKDKYPFDYALLKELEGDINSSFFYTEKDKHRLELVNESYKEASDAFIDGGWFALKEAMDHKIKIINDLIEEGL
jgi:hypothetical protein